MAPWSQPPLPPQKAAARQLPMVGRDPELATFERLWPEVVHGNRQVVFIGGEPGGGKTRLAAEVAGALHDEDVGVLVGTSSHDAGVPYQPFAEMLDHLFLTSPEGSLTHLVEGRSPELRRLTPHVDRHWSISTAGGNAGAEGRRELFEAVAGIFRALSEERALALVFDDLHWAQVPTLAMLEHVVRTSATARMLIVGTFRTTAPDRSDELTARIAELHRVDGVRRIDLSGLDTDAIAEYVSLKCGLTPQAARTPAAILRDSTGGNPFFLREVWTDLERRGGVGALGSQLRVPATVADTLAARLAGLGEEVRGIIELAAVLGDSFELATLVAASESGEARTIAFVDSAIAIGLIEEVEGLDAWAFVHSLVRQAVLDRLPPSRRIQLHERAALVLARRPYDVSLVPRLANHFLAAYVLGHHDEALRYVTEAGRLAERVLAFEEAAAWFERGAGLPENEPRSRADLLFEAATSWVKAGRFPRARAIYERLVATGEPGIRLEAALGYEDTNWRPGRPDTRAVDLLSAALADCGLEEDDTRYVRALASLGRALTFAGEIGRARQVGSRAIELARRGGDEATVEHALATSLWHGLAPEMADLQTERTTELFAITAASDDVEIPGQAVNFRAMVSYLCCRPEDLDAAATLARRVAQTSGQPYHQHISSCIAQAQTFMRGEFAVAEGWARSTLELNSTFGDDMGEGPHGVQMYMIHRETGKLTRFRGYLDGLESFEGRWVPGLLALYTELGIEAGVRRALDHLTKSKLGSRSDEGQWPMELVFLTEAALAIRDQALVQRLRPLLVEYEGLNLASGTLIAVFGSADRYLARLAAFVGADAEAEAYFESALRMDRRMRSAVHVAETLAHHALFAAGAGDPDRAAALARSARDIAEPVGQQRVLGLLAALPGTESKAPDRLTARELDVLRLLAAGRSNREIGEELHISANTAANHVRSILTKTGAANRTQAAMYATQHQLV